MKPPNEQRPEQSAQGASGQGNADQSNSTSALNKQQQERPVNKRATRRKRRKKRIVITTRHPERWTRPRVLTRLWLIFNLLVKNMGKEVAMNTLSSRSGCLTVHSAIDALRKGYRLAISNRIEWNSNGLQATCHSYYKLIGRVQPTQ
jgi:hypothetical protein